MIKQLLQLIIDFLFYIVGKKSKNAQKVIVLKSYKEQLEKVKIQLALASSKGEPIVKLFTIKQELESKIEELEK